MYCPLGGQFRDHLRCDCPHKDDDRYGYPYIQTPNYPEMFDVMSYLPVQPEYVAEEGPFQLKVKVYDRDTIAFPKTIIVDVESSDIVYNLTAKIQEKRRLSPDDQILRFGCEALNDDDAVLADYKIQKNFTLELWYVVDDPDFLIRKKAYLRELGLEDDTIYNLKVKSRDKEHDQIVRNQILQKTYPDFHIEE